MAVHAYAPPPHRVMGIPGIEIHHLEPDEDPIDLMLDLVYSSDGISFDKDNDIVVNMLPGDIGHSSTTSLAELPWRTVDLSFSALTPDNFHKTALENGSSIIWKDAQKTNTPEKATINIVIKF